MSHVDTDQPGDGGGAAHRRAARRARCRRRGRTREGRPEAVGQARPRRTGRRAAGVRRPGGCPRRRTGRAGGGELRARDRQRRVGGRARPRRAAVLLGQPGTPVRQADSRCRRARRHVQRAARRGRCDRAVELPDDHRVVGFRACARRRQRGARQTRRDHPADHDAAWPSSAVEAGLPDGLFQVLPGKGSVVGERFVSHPDVRKIVFTGSTEVGVEGDGGRGRPGEAGDAGTRRQERQHRLRRLRPGEGRGHGAVRRVRQRRAGLLCAQPDPGAAQRLRQVHGAARAGGEGPGGRRSRRRGTARWARWCPGRTSTPCRPTCPTTRPSPSAVRRHTGPDTGSRQRFSPRSAPIARSPRRSSAPS